MIGRRQRSVKPSGPGRLALAWVVAYNMVDLVNRAFVVREQQPVVERTVEN